MHAIIAGETLEKAIKISQLSLQTVITLLETQQDKAFSEAELKQSEEIELELDVQWQIYRTLNAHEERDIRLILDLKNELRESRLSNIGIEIAQ